MIVLVLWAALASIPEPDCVDLLTWTAGCPPYVLRLSRCEQAAVRACRWIQLGPSVP
ncbi:hypothetical protein LCGC14_2308840 [marine sediment metagenome]|uniref:Uncharacterized protein n=1 Tax=marine sediment metagenome TaxID=412755 RepID=A0A0F9FG40_9ZZZZ